MVLFNFVALNELGEMYSAWTSVLQLLLMIAVSFAATVTILAFLLGRIDHHIKFVPIIPAGVADLRYRQALSPSFADFHPDPRFVPGQPG